MIKSPCIYSVEGLVSLVKTSWHDSFLAQVTRLD